MAYDKQGRLKYDPELHDPELRGKPWSKEDREYLCSMHDAMPRKDLALALGRPETAVAAQLWYLREVNKYERYRKAGKS